MFSCIAMIKWFLSLFLLVFSLYGCSLLSESSSHPYSGYYKSNWTSDGNIIASKQVGNKIIGRNSDPEYEGASYIVEINLNSISSENIILNTNISSTYQDTLEWDSLHNLSYALSNSNKYVVYYSYDLNYLTTPTFIKFYKNESLLKSVSTAYPEGNSTEYRSNLSFNSAKDTRSFI